MNIKTAKKIFSRRGRRNNEQRIPRSLRSSFAGNIEREKWRDLFFHFRTRKTKKIPPSSFGQEGRQNRTKERDFQMQATRQPVFFIKKIESFFGTYTHTFSAVSVFVIVVLSIVSLTGQSKLTDMLSLILILKNDKPELSEEVNESFLPHDPLEEFADFNQDGAVDVKDTTLFVFRRENGSTTPYDLSQDGEINVLDLNFLRSLYNGNLSE